MNFNKFTLKSQEAIAEAQEIAQNYSNQQIEPVHLLAALIQSSDGVVIPILQKLGANVNYIKMKVNEELENFQKLQVQLLVINTSLKLWQEFLIML